MNKPPWKKMPKSDGRGISVRSTGRKLISGDSSGSSVSAAAWVELRMPGMSSAVSPSPKGFGGLGLGKASNRQRVQANQTGRLFLTEVNVSKIPEKHGSSISPPVVPYGRYVGVPAYGALQRLLRCNPKPWTKGWNR